MNKQVGFRSQVGRYALVGVMAVLITLVIGVTSVAASKITFIGVFTGWGPELQQALKNFTAKTGIEVELLQGTSWTDMMDKVKTMSAGGVAPDVIYGDNVRIMELAELGLLQPLDEMAVRDNVNLRNYPAMVLDGLRVKNKLFSLPTAVSIYATFYNVDTFNKMGVNMLSTNWGSNALSWDEWVSISKKLTVDNNGDGTPELYGLNGFGYQGGFNMLGMWNATDIDQDRTRYLGTDPAVIRALEKSTSLWTEHRVVGGNFYNGNSAIMTGQPVQLNTLLQRSASGNLFNWSLGILPKGDTRSAQTGFHSLGMSIQGRNQAEAWALIKYLAYDREGTLLFTRAENRVPVMAEPGRDFIQRWKAHFPTGNAQVLVDAIPVLWDWRIISGKGATAILNLETEAFNYIRTGQKSVREAVEFIAPRVQAALQ